jgi:DNA-binding GntR family transcriptional regulator
MNTPFPAALDDITVIKIFDSLRTQIIQGDIAPGAFINSVALAKSFGTSRTPIREALLMLDHYGLVMLEARRRPRVSDVSVKAIRDLYALRAAMHAYVSHAIVTQADSAAIASLLARAVALIEDLDRQSTEVHLQHVEAYLQTEFELAGNDEVLQVVDSLRWRIARLRRLGAMDKEELRTIAHDRVRVAHAYADRDGALAEAMNRSMLAKAAAYCERRFLAG